MTRQRRNRTIFQPSHRFQPRDVPGLLRDFDPSLCDVADGVVSPFFPEALTRADATQATGSKHATYRASVAAFGNRPALQFTLTKVYQTPTIDLTAFSAITIYMLWSTVAGGGALMVPLEFGDGSAGTTNFVLYRDTANLINAGLTGNVGTTRTLAERQLTTRPDVTTFVLDKTITASGQTSESAIYRSGIQANGDQGWVQFTNNTNAFGNLVLNIGARNNGASIGLNGYIARILLYSGAHDTLTRQKIERYLQTYYRLTRTSGILIFDGDSLTAGVGGTVSGYYPVATIGLMTGRDFAYGQYGIGGQTLATMTTFAPTKIDPLYDGTQSNVLVIWGGTNDLTNNGGNQTATVGYDRLVAYCQARKAVGWKVVVVTMLPRSDANTPGDFTTKRADFNTSVRTNYATFADALADVAANTTIGDDGDELNGTNYSADKVHMTNTGYAIVAGIVRTAIESITS